MVNERKTETLIRDRLRDAGHFDDSGVRVEEQKSDFPRIKKLLRQASKKGNGAGYPEFIVSSNKHSDFLIVVECKADETKHISVERDHYADYAVDGALLYASYLSREFDVLAIGASGQTDSTFQISHFLHLKGASEAIEFNLSGILPFEEYRESVMHSEAKMRQDYDALLAYSRDLNEKLQGSKIKESHRGLLICGILVALENEAFRNSFQVQATAKQLADSLGCVDISFQPHKGADKV